jgi:2-polyprenyl-3-methyl-5-hydroxy-6-metoxy-1,4-benzoquinol methylase
MPDSDRFNREAATWDHEERRVLLAQAIAAAIGARIPLAPHLEVLDFGCGTGLVSLALAPRVGAITGADTAPAMLAELQAKAGALGFKAGAVLLDGTASGSLGGPYDLIVSSMTLHHLPDVPAAFRQFAASLRPGGQVALADLDVEDGSFHEDAAGVHHQGFRREQIQGWLEEAGFHKVAVERAAETLKAGRTYGIFLATGTL